jgi:hypothetical protein
MHKKLVEIRELITPGYQPVFDFDSWRVAVLNYLGEIHLSQDGSVLIAENRNTSNNNSNYSTLDPDQRRVIIDTSRQEQAH